MRRTFGRDNGLLVPKVGVSQEQADARLLVRARRDGALASAGAVMPPEVRDALRRHIDWLERMFARTEG